MAEKNRTPEQQARDNIDLMLEQAGWTVQSKTKIDFSAGFGIAVREYRTDVGPADYVLFIAKKGIHAMPRENGWAVRREEASRDSSHHERNSDAVATGCATARRERVEFVTQDSDSYGGDLFSPHDTRV